MPRDDRFATVDPVDWAKSVTSPPLRVDLASIEAQGAGLVRRRRLFVGSGVAAAVTAATAIALTLSNAAVPVPVPQTTHSAAPSVSATTPSPSTTASTPSSGSSSSGTGSSVPAGALMTTTVLGPDGKACATVPLAGLVQPWTADARPRTLFRVVPDKSGRTPVTTVALVGRTPRLVMLELASGATIAPVKTPAALDDTKTANGAWDGRFAAFAVGSAEDDPLFGAPMLWDAEARSTTTMRLAHAGDVLTGPPLLGGGYVMWGERDRGSTRFVVVAYNIATRHQSVIAASGTPIAIVGDRLLVSRYPAHTWDSLHIGDWSPTPSIALPRTTSFASLRDFATDGTRIAYALGSTAMVAESLDDTASTVPPLAASLDPTANAAWDLRRVGDLIFRTTSDDVSGFVLVTNVRSGATAQFRDVSLIGWSPTTLVWAVTPSDPTKRASIMSMAVAPMAQALTCG